MGSQARLPYDHAHQDKNVSRRRDPRPRMRSHQTARAPQSKIEDNTKGRELFQLQEDHKVNWQEYNFQGVIDAVEVEAIVAAFYTQYVEHLEEDYVGSKNQNIRTMFEQLQTWYVITTKEKLAIKAHFLEPWSNTPHHNLCSSTGQAPSIFLSTVESQSLRPTKWTTSCHRCTHVTNLKPNFFDN